MTKRFSTPTGVVLVAIDMSKLRQEVLDFWLVYGGSN